MRNLKKILALALALVMTLSLMTTANAAFSDSKDVSAAYNEAVEVLNGMGVFKGYTDGSFAPKASITRAEVAAIIYRIVTGDVADTQAKIYADYARFSDVRTNAWYAGYVGYCANAEYIKGNGDGTFDPEGKVTGYQALAMILRAMGYDQNGEFTGAGWEVRVASTAQQRDILVNVNSGTLGVAATRELVAELLFQAIQKNTVVYTPALGYYTADWLASNTTSLGMKTFGLASAESYIVGNQATGEAATILGYNTTTGTVTTETAAYTAANAVGNKSFKLNTTLEQFGHQTKVWYSSKSAVGGVYQTVYATFDKATNASITDADYALMTAAQKAPYVAASAYYDDFTAGAVAAAPARYNVVVNNANGTKALIGVYLTIDRYTAINNYFTTKTVSFATAGTLPQGKVDGFTTLNLGAYVNMNRVTGTAGSDATKTGGFYKYNVSALGVVQGVVSYVNNLTRAITLNGVEVKYSYDELVASATAPAVGLSVPATWSFVTTYNVFTDMLGNYVAAVPATGNISYLKATYAYYQTNIVDGSIKYYAQGVDMTGAIQTVELAIDAGTYNGLICTRLDWSGNTITNTGTNNMGVTQDLMLTPAPAPRTGYAIVPGASLSTIGTITGGSGATVTAQTVALGTSFNYFVDANTSFYYVTGYGATVKVDAFQGLTALLNGNRNCMLPKEAVVKTTRVYSASVHTDNYHIDAVLIGGAPALTGVSTLIYVPTVPVLQGGTVNSATTYYGDVYLNGEKTQVIMAASTGTITAQTFYNYTVSNGVYWLADVSSSSTARVEDAQLNRTGATGNSYLFVTDAAGVQRSVAVNAKIINLVTGVANVPTTALELIVALEINNITVDAEIVNGTVVNLYLVGYAQK